MRAYLAARWRSFGYAFKGLWWLVSTQAHARIHALATVVAITMGFGLRISHAEWLAIIVSIGMVWMAEAFNTALEFLTDRVSTEAHPLAGKAKDTAAAAVLLAAMAAAVVGLLIFLPKLALVI